MKSLKHSLSLVSGNNELQLADITVDHFDNRLLFAAVLGSFLESNDISYVIVGEQACSAYSQGVFGDNTFSLLVDDKEKAKQLLSVEGSQDLSGRLHVGYFVINFLELPYDWKNTRFKSSLVLDGKSIDFYVMGLHHLILNLVIESFKDNTASRDRALLLLSLHHERLDIHKLVQESFRLGKQEHEHFMAILRQSRILREGTI